MAKRTRRCVDCKTDISNRGNKSTRCKPCQAAYRDLRLVEDPARGQCVDADGTCSKSRLKRGRCSRHYYTARRDNGWKIPQQPRPCATCGVVFTPVRSDAVCCSGVCNWRKQDALARVNYPERPCPTCGKTYKPKSIRQRYCSIECIADPGERASRRWAARNSHVMSEHYHRRRVRIRTNRGSVGVSERDWLRLVNRYGGRCAYCGKRPDLMTKDHVVPISRGGRHSIGNVLPACGSCNSAKRDVLLAEFKRRMKRDEGRRVEVSAVATLPSRVTGLLALIGGGDGSANPVRYEQLSLGICCTTV